MFLRRSLTLDSIFSETMKTSEVIKITEESNLSEFGVIEGNKEIIFFSQLDTFFIVISMESKKDLFYFGNLVKWLER